MEQDIYLKRMMQSINSSVAKDIKTAIETERENCPDDFVKDVQDANEFLDTLIDIIENRITTEPRYIGNEYHCPACGGRIANQQLYCDKCGQAIKWGGTLE